MRIKISNGNIKMGKIPSISLPSWTTCRNDCECRLKCYGHKIEHLRKNVKAAYQENYEYLLSDPESFWREVEGVIMMSRFFRFHVSGDIPDKEYFINMIKVAIRNKHCEIMCFTKKYEIVNEVIREFGKPLPENLHVLLSAWRNFTFENPYGLPEAHVRFKDGYTTASENAIECGGNCSKCAITNSGCWVLESGDQIVINEH